ncbi:hypothetical protein BRC81_00290 [Halobacteriales archaeon QS_1_68_20]|nr:MAG: hypothetical protein BRC81_00290 [Halobacteriales archaeon QS_1_68_20]
MATDVNEQPGIAGDWKVKVLTGLFLFLVGIVGLADVLPIGWAEPVQWTTSTVLVLIGLSVVMYGFANIT